jgi:capsid protein
VHQLCREIWPRWLAAAVLAGALDIDDPKPAWAVQWIIVNIQARDFESFRRSRTQVAAEIARAVQIGRRGL